MGTRATPDLMFLGVYLLNEPFDPANRKLPAIYFSDHWHWEADKADLAPRRERWGGLLFALLGLLIYLAWVRKDHLGRNLGLFVVLFGGLGFALGQCVQAYRAWHPQVFASGPLSGADPYMNWWNMMEITFGVVLGFGLALDLWLNRRLIGGGNNDAHPELVAPVEWLLVVVHAAALITWNFLSIGAFDAFADHALTMGLIPLVCIVGGRWWPYVLPLPLLALPIAGKTLWQMCYSTHQIPVIAGWLCLVLLPMLITVTASILFALGARQGQDGRTFARWALVLSTWLYFCLNFAISEFPWPWEDPTGRTPSAVIFTVCVVILTTVALVYGRGRGTGESIVGTKRVCGPKA